MGELIQAQHVVYIINAMYVYQEIFARFCGEWVECMGAASGCGKQEAGVTSGSGWNLWVWLVGVVVRR